MDDRQSSQNHTDLIDVQIALSEGSSPHSDDLISWAKSALPPDKANSELTIRIVDIDESRSLNRQYRHQDKPTNVLSFPSDLPPEMNIPLLGDLVICADIVKSEASIQGKEENAHWAHMVIHGTLHLLGYDHIEEQEATIMETLETDIMTRLGYPPPYAPINSVTKD